MIVILNQYKWNTGDHTILCLRSPLQVNHHHILVCIITSASHTIRVVSHHSFIIMIVMCLGITTQPLEIPIIIIIKVQHHSDSHHTTYYINTGVSHQHLLYSSYDYGIHFSIQAFDNQLWDGGSPRLAGVWRTLSLCNTYKHCSQQDNRKACTSVRRSGWSSWQLLPGTSKSFWLEKNEITYSTQTWRAMFRNTAGAGPVEETSLDVPPEGE